jgi:hypothetical protein
MTRLRVRSLTIDLGPGIGEVEINRRRRATAQKLDAALACGFHALQDIVFDDQRARVVVLTGLQHGARG